MPGRNGRRAWRVPYAWGLWWVVLLQAAMLQAAPMPDDAGRVPRPALVIPQVVDTAPRNITVDDIAGMRQILAFSLSPDKRRYAIFVQQPDVALNLYRSGWFVGEVAGGALVPVGDGGEVRFNAVGPMGVVPGDLLRPQVRWSPDSRWIAYTLKRDGEVQLWRSDVQGGAQEQVTRNEGDVIDFEWSAEGAGLFFTVGTSRHQRRARDERRARTGYRYDHDLMTYLDLTKPVLREPPERDPALWWVAPGRAPERLATAAEQVRFGQLRPGGQGHEVIAAVVGAANAPVVHANGARAWLAPPPPGRLETTVLATPAGGAGAAPLRGPTGQILKLWWSDDGEQVLFLRRNDITRGGIADYALHAWRPGQADTPVQVALPDTFLWHWEQVEIVDGRLIVLRETLSRPRHVAAIDLRDGAIEVLADVNPELRNVRIGRIEKLEWDTPRFDWNAPGAPLAGIYPERVGGYILYPPDFDPTQRYPVFIDPYAVAGFSRSSGNEHPLQAYAASGIVVLQLSYPVQDIMRVVGPRQEETLGLLYSGELDYPHLAMNMESTRQGLDAAVARGFVDPQRVGIGGVSQGTYAPLYLLQKYDRLAAVSISASSWGPEEYYWPTALARAHLGRDWRPRPTDEAGREYWRRIDIAEHIDTVEAPVLMHHPLGEVHTAVRFMRHLADAGKPYDAYIFTNEFHVKWQPAHIQAVMQRNLDWFRFWLQDFEPARFGADIDGADVVGADVVGADIEGADIEGADIDGARRDQYARWRALRAMQCRNPRSLRDYCGR